MNHDIRELRDEKELTRALEVFWTSLVGALIRHQLQQTAERGRSWPPCGPAPDLSLGVATLAAVYLGGSRWWPLARAGRVVEHRPGSLALAERLFGVDRAPFVGTMF